MYQFKPRKEPMNYVPFCTRYKITKGKVKEADEKKVVVLADEQAVPQSNSADVEVESIAILSKEVSVETPSEPVEAEKPSKKVTKKTKEELN
jgi:hypothetical protein